MSMYILIFINPAVNVIMNVEGENIANKPCRDDSRQTNIKNYSLPRLIKWESIVTESIHMRITIEHLKPNNKGYKTLKLSFIQTYGKLKFLC